MTTKISVETADGRVFESVYAYGVTYRSSVLEHIPGRDLAGHIENVMNMDIRDDDMYLASYQKSGTHWVWEIMNMLRKRSAEYERKVKDSAMLDMLTMEKAEQMNSPRILNCHYPPKLIPKQILKKKIKIVHVQRNPKDVCVSAYHHIASFSPYPGVKTFGDFLPFMLGTNGIDFFYPWCQYVKEWESFSKKHPEQILNLYYEDLKEDPVREIQKINEFLNTGCSAELISQISQACDFSNLQRADTEVKEMDFFKSRGKNPMYRKGEVGDWKNWFTVAQSEQMDAWLQTNMAGSQLSFRYTL
ncbi:sulfotransferase 1A1-like [Dreissena polymorpha]|uniref:Sulfotransferase domain-containing protein n=1 Tax=Dreissena polymorpha TaxID=45954 RepID=A0A9D4KY88_DREPO|nr:sulfotransferase 1A1-like [Dreissena polymorpha]KAH3848345.1 hypothetical protein DPMN_090705 [Dreissena polymorpha]